MFDTTYGHPRALTARKILALTLPSDYASKNIIFLLLATKIAKESYGFDSFSIVPGNGSNSDPTECKKDCLKAEFSNFAKKCRRTGGFFKCCRSG